MPQKKISRIILTVLAALFLAAALPGCSSDAVGKAAGQNPAAGQPEREAIAEGADTGGYEELIRENNRLKAENEQLKNGPRGFYQKLRNGRDVSILIVGDSIGLGSGASEEKTWPALLRKWLEETWYGNISVKNISLGANTSYAGYVSVMEQEDGEEYDLAILCYGENDSASGFSREYEGMIRSLYGKYRHCSLIAILESSQREETDKIKEIRRLAEHYGFPCADTIAAFRDSGRAYDELSTDGTHPNEEGYRLYAEALEKIISEGAEAWREGDAGDAAPLNADMEEYENFYMITPDQAERKDDRTFVVPFYGILSAFPGIDRELKPGNTSVTISVDGAPEIKIEGSWEHDYSQRVISRLSKEPVTISQSLTLRFDDPSQADGLLALVFTGR